MKNDDGGGLQWMLWKRGGRRVLTYARIILFLEKVRRDKLLGVMNNL